MGLYLYNIRREAVYGHTSDSIYGNGSRSAVWRRKLCLWGWVLCSLSASGEEPEFRFPRNRRFVLDVNHNVGGCQFKWILRWSLIDVFWRGTMLFRLVCRRSGWNWSGLFKKDFISLYCCNDFLNFRTILRCFFTEFCQSCQICTCILVWFENTRFLLFYFLSIFHAIHFFFQFIMYSILFDFIYFRILLACFEYCQILLLLSSCANPVCENITNFSNVFPLKDSVLDALKSFKKKLKRVL